MKQIISKNGIDLVLTAIILFTVLPVIHILLSHRSDLPLIVGDRCEAIFDLWSFQHLFSGVLIGSLLVYFKQPSNPTWQRFVLALLILALSWEAVELTMESGLFGQAVSHWKRGFEHWGNRFIGDPSLVVLGGLLARRFKSLWKWALIPASVWLFTNVIAPNSMTVQELLFKP